MPKFERNLAANISRGLKAFASFRVGATRGDVPQYVEAKEVGAASGRREVGEFREVRRRLAAAEKEAVRLRAGLAGRGEEPPTFFLVGNGRSGTTWLMKVLNAHPEVLCRGEGYLLNRNFRRDDLAELHPRLKTSSVYNALAESEAMRLWIERSVWTAGDDPEEHLDDLTRIAVRYFMEKRLARARKRIVGDKTPFISSRAFSEMVPVPGGESHVSASSYEGAEVLEEIHKLHPNARAIHIIRDGRDVAVSLMHFMWSRARDREGGLYYLSPEEIERREAYREDPAALLASEGLFTEERLAFFAQIWKAQVSEAIERGPDALGGKYHEIRYENLLESPEKEMSRIFDFLGADASEGTVKECVEATSFERTSGRKSGEEESSSVKFRKGIAGDWKNVFTERDKEIFKAEAGDLLVRLGYEEDGDW